MQLQNESLKKFRLGRIQNIASAIPVQCYSQLSWQANWGLVIGHFHDDDIWLQLPEFISFLLSYLNLSIPLRIKEQ